jgi:hypothetical protein
MTDAGACPWAPSETLNPARSPPARSRRHVGRASRRQRGCAPPGVRFKGSPLRRMPRARSRPPRPPTDRRCSPSPRRPQSVAHLKSWRSDWRDLAQLRPTTRACPSVARRVPAPNPCQPSPTNPVRATAHPLRRKERKPRALRGLSTPGPVRTCPAKRPGRPRRLAGHRANAVRGSGWTRMPGGGSRCSGR